MKTIAIVDYGLGNLRSVSRGLEKAGAATCITSKKEEIATADGIVLPGVGAFREGMEQLGPVADVITEADGHIPLLGICLGMQMLMEESEEHGLSKGLGLIPGKVRRFPRAAGMKVPHMGWNSVFVEQGDNPLVEGLATEEFFYFVHSYYADTDRNHTLTSTMYICPFASSIFNGTTYGVQFHPEKSGSVGLRLLKNFIDMV